ncbi:MAG: hypothetical protein AABW99_04705 [archaeon]
MKKLFLLALMLGFIAANASAVSVELLNISISVNNEGYAGITENYFLKFTSPFEEDDFKQKAVGNSSSLLSWEASYNFFYPRFAESAGNELDTSSIIYDEGSKTLTLKYALKKTFAALLREEQRANFFRINDRQFASFNEGGTIVIPEGTNIQLTLPTNSELQSDPPENAIVNGNQIILRGIQTNALTIDYKALKPIASNPFEIFTDNSGIYFILLPVLIIVAIFAYIKREEVEQRIEDYLVKHSEIKPRTEDEDIELSDI